MERVAEHVRWVDLGDSVIALCLKSGTFVGFNGSAREIWKALADGDSAHAIGERLHRAHGVSGAIAQADVQSFTETCRRRRLLDGGVEEAARRQTHPPAAARRTAPTRARALQAILTARALIRWFGFARGYAHAVAVAERFPAGRASPDAMPVARATEAFLAAEYVVPSLLGHDDCLSRSLALFRFLRCAGLPVVHRIGVRATPFAAHAWVTLDGASLLEESARQRSFIPIATLS